MDETGIVITTAKVSDEGESFYLQATTRGGVKVQVEMQLALACSFTVNEGPKEIIIPYKAGETINMLEKFNDVFKPTTDNEVKCPANTFYEYTNEDQYPTNPSRKTNIDGELKFVMSDKGKGRTTRYFAYGNPNAEEPSNLVDIDVVVCGKETIRARGPSAEIINAEKVGGLTVKEIKAETYKEWFTVDVDPRDGSDKCDIGSVKLVKRVVKDGELTYEPLDSGSITVDEATDSSIKIDLNTRMSSEVFYLEASTKGGVVARKEMIITVEIKCGIT